MELTLENDIGLAFEKMCTFINIVHFYGKSLSPLERVDLSIAEHQLVSFDYVIAVRV